jgi:peptidyl-prolyl cis-trans isomerase D
MIGWMQNNKKYLIVTLWISTFAFVGAGFVGWGSYQYGSKGRSIATVGSEEIELSDFQMVYSNLYGYYSQMFKGQFDEEMAKRFGLQDTAFNILKREALLLNLAKEYRLKSLDVEIARAIYENQSFFKDGNFSREQYQTVLKSSRMTPADYEKRVAKDILIEKLNSLLGVSLTPFESELFKNLFGISDKFELKMISSDSIEISVTEDEVAKYWELNRENYKTEEQFKISHFTSSMIDREPSEEELKSFYSEHQFEFVGSFEDNIDSVKEKLIQKESKKEAMKSYLAFKKGNYQGEVSSSTVGEINLILGSDEMRELKAMKSGEIMKPKLMNGEFVTVRLDEVVPPEVEKFESVKDLVEVELTAKKREEKLLEVAKAEVKGFTGEKSDFLRLGDAGNLPTVPAPDKQRFLQEVFSQQTESGFVKVTNGIVLYRIVDQKFDTEAIDSISAEEIIDLKYKIQGDMLIKKLEYHYPTQVFFNSKG